MIETQESPAEIAITAGRVTVTVIRAGHTSTARIHRHDDTEPVGYITIGTRDPGALTRHLDDVPVTLRPGPGRYMRSSFRVRADHKGIRYDFRPKSPDTSRLHRDGVPLGDATIREDGTIDIVWHESAEPTAPDAAVGYALAAAFGTGAQFFLMMLLDLLSHVPD